MNEEMESSGGIGRFVLLAIIAAVLAVTFSEGLREKILDTLFGAEEEFDYTPAQSKSINGADAMNGSAATAASEAGKS
jgi:hypothetical protein